MVQPSSFEPEIEKSRLDNLRHRLDRACEEAKVRPDPVAPFESDKERFGLTHQRYQQLLFAWQDFLREDRKSSNDSRIGPDHDSWPAFWKKLQSFQHYKIEIEDINLHFIHEKASTTASGQKPIPLLLLHGWPSSVIDFFEVIKPLAHPGDQTSPTFNVVVPSHTGYLWSSSPTVDGFGRGKHSGPQGDFLIQDEARIVHKLMLSLGYRRYAIQAGDWGSSVARIMAKLYPRNVAAVHLNICPAPPPLLTPPLLKYISRLIPTPIYSIASALIPKTISQLVQTIREYPRRDMIQYVQQPGFLTVIGHVLLGLPAPLSKGDIAKLRQGIDFMSSGSAYAAMQGSRPSTLGLVIQSDPGALLAWVGEKLLQWTDKDPSDAEICAILTMYWCTDTMPRSIYQYRNRPPSGLLNTAGDRSNFIKQPMGYSDFPKELFPSPLSWVKGTANVQWYRQHSSGGHFCSIEKPTEYVEDLRDCFGKIWPD